MSRFDTPISALQNQVEAGRSGERGIVGSLRLREVSVTIVSG